MALRLLHVTPGLRVQGERARPETEDCPEGGETGSVDGLPQAEAASKVPEPRESGRSGDQYDEEYY